MPKPIKSFTKKMVNRRSESQSLTSGFQGDLSKLISSIENLEFSPDDGIKMCIYGQSGSGKTTLWSTFPKPILVAISSGGRQKEELRSVATEENEGKIKALVLERSNDIMGIIEYQNSLPIKNQFKTLVLDHVSGFQDLVLKEILGLEILPEQKSWGLATRENYGTCTNRCKDYLRNLLSLQCNVVIIGQERTIENEAPSSEMLAPTIGVGVTPSLAGWLYTSCSFVVQTYKRRETIEKKTKINGKVKITTEFGRKTEFCLRTGPDPIITTKFRVPLGTPLPHSLLNPTYEEIMKLVNGEYSE